MTQNYISFSSLLFSVLPHLDLLFEDKVCTLPYWMLMEICLFSPKTDKWKAHMAFVREVNYLYYGPQLCRLRTSSHRPSSLRPRTSQRRSHARLILPGPIPHRDQGCPQLRRAAMAPAKVTKLNRSAREELIPNDRLEGFPTKPGTRIFGNDDFRLEMQGVRTCVPFYPQWASC